MVASRQKGMTMWGMIFVLGTVAFFLFLFFKLLPVYLEDMKVQSAFNGLMREPGIEAMSRNDIIERLVKRFDIDNITNVDLIRHLEIRQQGKMKLVSINYEAVVPLAYNVSALLEFQHAHQVSSSE